MAEKRKGKPREARNLPLKDARQFTTESASLRQSEHVAISSRSTLHHIWEVSAGEVDDPSNLIRRLCPTCHALSTIVHNQGRVI